MICPSPLTKEDSGKRKSGCSLKEPSWILKREEDYHFSLTQIPLLPFPIKETTSTPAAASGLTPSCPCHKSSKAWVWLPWLLAQGFPKSKRKKKIRLKNKLTYAMWYVSVHNNSKTDRTKLFFRDAYTGGKTRKKSKEIIITGARWSLPLVRRMETVIGGWVGGSGVLIMFYFLNRISN